MNCDICNKWIKHKKNWIRHCKTKGHLKRALERPEETHKRPQSNPVEPESNPVNPKSNPVEPQSNPVDLQSNPESNTDSNPKVTQCNPEVTQKIQCKYCDKEFKYKQGRSRHEKHRCELRPQEQATNITNNITNHNIDNTTHNTQVINQIVVQVHVRGQEDFSRCFSIEDLPDLLGLTGAELLTTVARQMFGSDENKSIACPNIKTDFGIVKRIEGPRTEYIPPVLNDVINRLPEDLKHTMISMINIARENGYYKNTTPKTYAIDDKKIVIKIYNEMIKVCNNTKERKIVEKSLKALFHNNKLLIKEAREDL